jgi:hydroxymethylpyrimidine kinase/phosphomethylpyrimidine kinase
MHKELPIDSIDAADLKVITVHGCYGLTTFTALTAQNTQGVRDIHNVPPEFISSSLEAIFFDISIDVVKTGMLATAGAVNAVVRALRKWNAKCLVVDPVGNSF